MTDAPKRKRRADARDLTERIDVMVTPADREAWKRLLAGRLGDIARVAADVVARRASPAHGVAAALAADRDARQLAREHLDLLQRTSSAP